MAGADLAAEITAVAVRRQEPEDVGLLGGRRQIELVSHFVRLSFRCVERGLQACEVRDSARRHGFLGKRGPAPKSFSRSVPGA